jgi:DNA repair protein RadC
MQANVLEAQKKIMVVDWNESTILPEFKLNNSERVVEYARIFYKADLYLYESVFIILIAVDNSVLGYAKISQGSVNGTVVDGRLVAKYAIDTLASAVILVHNHPSGDKYPSNADIKLSKDLKKQLSIFKINFLDSIILTGESYYSMLDEGEM